jgi:nucleotide-binding universal stress UspA family protein/uncharacterized protein (DUF2267 family)
MLPFRTILYPTDFSDCSRHAGDLALHFAKEGRARLVLLHAIEPPNYSPDLAIALADLDVLRASSDAELQEFQKLCQGVYCERMVAFGYPATEIVRVASEVKADLIVLGSHGRTGIGRLMMGSVAEEVIRRAACPVMVAKPSDVLEAPEYDDWVAAAMAPAMRRVDSSVRAAEPHAMSGRACAGYAQTIEHTVRTTNRWLRDVRIRLGDEHASQAFRLLRAVLHVLRDHLSVDQVASLAAQLPLLLRGILYEGWDPTGKPQKLRHGAEFINEVKAQIAPEPIDQPEWSVRAVLTALSSHLTPGEVCKLKRALPHEIRDLWEARLADKVVVQ